MEQVQHTPWWRRRIPLSIAVTAIFAAGGIGATRIIDAADDASDAKVFALEKDLAHFQSQFLPGSPQLETRMSAVSRLITGNDGLDVICSAPKKNGRMLRGYHRKSPQGNDSYIQLHWLWCSAIETAVNGTFSADENEADAQHRAAADGVFALSHEFGHEIAGASEETADCYGALLFTEVVELMRLPDEVRTLAPPRPDSC